MHICIYVVVSLKLFREAMKREWQIKIVSILSLRTHVFNPSTSRPQCASSLESGEIEVWMAVNRKEKRFNYANQHTNIFCIDKYLVRFIFNTTTYCTYKWIINVNGVGRFFKRIYRRHSRPWKRTATGPACRRHFAVQKSENRLF